MCQNITDQAVAFTVLTLISPIRSHFGSRSTVSLIKYGAMALSIPSIFGKKTSSGRGRSSKSGSDTADGNGDADSKSARHAAQKRVNAKMHYALDRCSSENAKNKWSKICELPGRRSGKNEMKKDTCGLNFVLRLDFVSE